MVTAALHHLGPGSFKGTIIGIEVFGLSPTHDTGRQSIVRVTISALRTSLARYYETEGRGQPIRVRIPGRSYEPEFRYAPEFARLTLDSTSAMHVANARALMNQRLMPSFRDALRYLQLALDRHPEHPRLLALIAMNHAASAQFGAHPRSAFDLARSYCGRAAQSAHPSWELPVVEAFIAMHAEFDRPKAARLFDRAIELNSTAALHHTWYRTYLASQLRWTEFLALEEESASGAAYECSYSRGRLALAHLVTGQHATAGAVLKQLVEIFPQPHYTAALTLGMLRESLDNFRGAAEIFEQTTTLTTTTTIALGLRALAIGLAGDRGSARRTYDQLLIQRQASDRFIPAVQLGFACIGAGDLEAALKWLTIGFVDECDPWSSWIAILPIARHLRHDSRFVSLVENCLKLKFPGGATSRLAATNVSHELTM